MSGFRYECMNIDKAATIDKSLKVLDAPPFQRYEVCHNSRITANVLNVDFGNIDAETPLRLWNIGSAADTLLTYVRDEKRAVIYSVNFILQAPPELKQSLGWTDRVEEARGFEAPSCRVSFYWNLRNTLGFLICNSPPLQRENYPDDGMYRSDVRIYNRWQRGVDTVVRKLIPGLEKSRR